MSATTRMAAAFSLVILTSAPAIAGEGRFRPFGFLRLADRGERTVHRVAPAPTYYQPTYPTAETYATYDDAPPAVEAAAYVPTESAQPALTYGGDPYGFVAMLNQYRASAGLHPVSVDPNLSAWASQNNAAQARRGIGHHVNPNCFQNCAWNHASAAEVLQGWHESPGHRANMLSPSITRVGIAYGPGPYWTMNAR